MGDKSYKNLVQTLNNIDDLSLSLNYNDQGPRPTVSLSISQLTQNGGRPREI